MESSFSIAVFPVLIIFGMLGLGAFIAFAGAMQRQRGRDDDDPQKRLRQLPNGMSLLMMLGALVAVAVGLLVMLFFVGSPVPMPGVPVTETAIEIRAEPRTTTQVEGTPTAAADKKPAPDPELPEWARLSVQMVRPGLVPEMLFVCKSKLCVTEEEAQREALIEARSVLKQRMAGAYPKMNWALIPESVFRQYSQRQTYVQRRMHDFKTFESEMFTAYIQFEDSPQVRENIIAEWERSDLATRIEEYILIGGATILGLGGLSGALRFAASRSRRSNPPLPT